MTLEKENSRHSKSSLDCKRKHKINKCLHMQMRSWSVCRDYSSHYSHSITHYSQVWIWALNCSCCAQGGLKGRNPGFAPYSSQLTVVFTAQTWLEVIYFPLANCWNTNEANLVTAKCVSFSCSRAHTWTFTVCVSLKCQMIHHWGKIRPCHGANDE